MNKRYLIIDPEKVTISLARKQMTRKELSDSAGIRPANLNAILKRKTVAPKTAGIIAAALDVDVADILQLPEREAMHEAR